MDIVIKNVTGEPDNDWYILELKKCGFPEGKIVYDTVYDPRNNSCHWSSGTDHCVAYLGQTCEENRVKDDYSITAENGNMFRYREIGNDSYVVSFYEQGKIVNASYAISFRDVQKERNAWVARGYKTKKKSAKNGK
jgi:hypothetical protein